MISNNPDIFIDYYTFFVYMVALIGFFQCAILRNVNINSRLLGYIIMTVCALAFGLTSENASAAVDRINYQIYYLNVNNFLYTSSISEQGFFYFCKICHLIFGRRETLFFLLCATIYAFSYYKAINLLSNNSFYTWLLCLLSIGFMAYSVNTMREGLGIALLLLGINSYNREKRFLFIVCCILAFSFHVSLLLPIVCFCVATQKIKIKYCYYIWVGFFLISLLGLSNYLTQFSDILQIDRFSGYLYNSDSERYETGFRWGFVIYSLFPMILGGLFIYKYNYSNAMYSKLYKTYILTNAVWLLFIKIPYTDRIAYLSWFLLPFLLSIPIVDNTSSIKSKPLFLAISIVALLFARFV